MGAIAPRQNGIYDFSVPSMYAIKVSQGNDSWSLSSR
jgi:hypothetical protein